MYYLLLYFVNNRREGDSFLSIDLYNKHYNKRVKDIYKLKDTLKPSFYSLIE